MNVLYKGSFLRDASKLNDRLIKRSIVEVIQIVKSASSISKINRLVNSENIKFIIA
jgi:hypothetical protein